MNKTMHVIFGPNDQFNNVVNVYTTNFFIFNQIR